jgi:hypothetical protein
MSLRLESPSGLVSKIAPKPVKRVKPPYLPPSQEGHGSALDRQTDRQERNMIPSKSN